MTKRNIIILICVLVVFVGFEGIFSKALQAALWDVLAVDEPPVYPALVKASDESFVVNGIRMKTLYLKGENIVIPEVVDYYKKVMAQRGWVTKGEQILPDNSVELNFNSQDMRMFSLSFIPGENVGRPNYVLVRMSYSLEGTDKWSRLEPGVSNADMPGEDIPWLKRYPESIRMNSLNDENGLIQISYMITDYTCLECVLDFYRQQLGSKGWELITTYQATKEELLKDLGQDFAKIPISDGFMPEATKMLGFKKDNNVFTIIVTYRSNAGDVEPLFKIGASKEKINQASEEEKERYRQQLEEEVEKIKQNRLANLMLRQQQSKERIDFTITYAPEAKLKERQRAWF